jgi:hypothetical protein
MLDLSIAADQYSDWYDKGVTIRLMSGDTLISETSFTFPNPSGGW